MENENGKTPAHPILETSEHHSVSLGLTKREYFVAMAMQGLLSNEENSHKEPDSLAKRALDMADAALKAIETPCS